MIIRTVVANTAAVLRAPALIALAIAFAACSPNIGDSCTTNVDCAQDGSRDCDQSQPGGYCTIDGCDEQSCPSGSVCIRIFPYEAEGLASCNWLTDAQPGPGAVCSDEQATDDAGMSCVCPADEICMPDGHCVSRAAERDYCLNVCSNNGDCRSGYVCRQAGVQGKAPVSKTYGSIALVANPGPTTSVNFCAPAE